MRRTPLFAPGGAALAWLLAGCPATAPCSSNDDCASGYICSVGDSSAKCVPADDDRPVPVPVPVPSDDAGAVDDDPDAGAPTDEDAGPDAGPDPEPPADAGPDLPNDAGAPPVDAGPAFEGLRLRGELVPGSEVSAGGSFVLDGRLGRPFTDQPLTSASYRLRLRPEPLR